jgi:hypothetical protein
VNTETTIYRLTVITSDAGMAANVGGAVATYTRTFDLPDEICEYIRSQMGTYSHVTFGLDRQEPQP